MKSFLIYVPQLVPRAMTPSLIAISIYMVIKFCVEVINS